MSSWLRLAAAFSMALLVGCNPVSETDNSVREGRPIQSESSVLARFSLDATYSIAKVVALVRVEGGEVRRVEDTLCGAVYRAIVKELYKGDLAQDIHIDFHGPMGLAVGRHYLVFLTSYDGTISQNLQFAGGQPFPAACVDAMPTLRPISHYGDIVGGIESLFFDQPPKELDFDTSWDLPSALEWRLVSLDTNLGGYARRRVRTEDVLSYLRGEDKAH